MGTNGRRGVEQWLAAEREADEARAERALAQLFRHVGRREPPRDFADSVLHAAGYRRQRAMREWSRWWRAAVAACLVAAGLAAPAVPLVLSTVYPFAAHVVWRATWRAAAAAWQLAGQLAGAALQSWDVSIAVGGFARLVLTTREAVLLVLVNVVVAAACLYGLKRLLAPAEELVQC